jgi:uncharacterized protein YkwD
MQHMPRSTGPRRRFLAHAVVAATFAVVAPLAAVAQTTAPVLDEEEAAFLATINDYRRQQGLQPLAVSPILTNAAKWMAEDMANRDYFSHTDSLGRAPDARLQAFGYPQNVWWGENIAAGNWTAAATFVQWRDSAGHNANMLNPNFTVIGIGRKYGSGRYGWYWVTDFGSYADEGTTATPPGTSTTPVTTTTETSTPTTTSPTNGRRGRRWR